MIDLNLIKNKLPINKFKLNQFYQSIDKILDSDLQNDKKNLAIIELFSNYINDFILELEEPKLIEGKKSKVFRRIG